MPSTPHPGGKHVFFKAPKCHFQYKDSPDTSQEERTTLSFVPQP